MAQRRYRIVFSGEIGFDYTLEEVKENLCRLTGLDAARVEEFFQGRKVALKSELDEGTAARYKAALDRTGVLCAVEPMPEEAPPLPSRPAAPRTCPACGHGQEGGTLCERCGIVFDKFARAQAFKAALASGEGAPAPAASVPVPSAAAGEEPQGYFARHQEQAFILKAFALIGVLVLLRGFLSGGVLVLAFFLFPVAFLSYVRLRAAASGENASEVLRQHITFMPVMYTDGERKREGAAWVTYLLIALNIFVFYGIELRVGPEALDNFLFLPRNPTPWNVPVSAFTSMFLHAGGGHLWGNMLFLWAVGTVVEKRIGAWRFLGLYLLTGLAAGAFGVFVHRTFMGTTLHALGASGAIAGVMGIFAVRCYFKSMVFPLPILGIFSLILPVSLKVRLNSLVIIGLFFLADLSGGIAQVSGAAESMVGHWIHIGGMLAGIVLAMGLRLGDQAIEERHLEIGAAASVGGRVGLEAGEESLRIALKQNPENTEALLLLARLVSRYGRTDEGRELYGRAVALLAGSRPKEAAAAFREFHAAYMEGVEPSLLYRLAGTFHREGDLDGAALCLELISADPGAPASLREKAMFQQARMLDDMGLAEAAAGCYARFIEAFPASANLEKARARLAAG